MVCFETNTSTGEGVACLLACLIALMNANISILLTCHVRVATLPCARKVAGCKLQGWYGVCFCIVNQTREIHSICTTLSQHHTIRLVSVLFGSFTLNTRLYSTLLCCRLYCTIHDYYHDLVHQYIALVQQLVIPPSLSTLFSPPPQV